MTDTKLDAVVLPCPFCSTESARVDVEGGNRRFVHCRGCDGCGPLADNRRDAVAAWNRRTPVVATSDEPLPAVNTGAHATCWRRIEKAAVENEDLRAQLGHASGTIDGLRAENGRLYSCAPATAASCPRCAKLDESLEPLAESGIMVGGLLEGTPGERGSHRAVLVREIEILETEERRSALAGAQRGRIVEENDDIAARLADASALLREALAALGQANIERDAAWAVRQKTAQRADDTLARAERAEALIPKEGTFPWAVAMHLRGHLMGRPYVGGYLGEAPIDMNGPHSKATDWCVVGSHRRRGYEAEEAEDAALEEMKDRAK